MSYTTYEEHKDIELQIPITAENINYILDIAYGIEFNIDGNIRTVSMGRGECFLTGVIRDGKIVFDTTQGGSYCNCESGIHSFMKKFSGSGIIEETGEEGEFEATKYVSGFEQKGRVVFD